jgi:hypothetical protein
LAEGLDMFRLVAVATDGRMILSGNLSFTKITLVGCLGVEPRSVGIALADGCAILWGGGDHFG